MWNHAPAMKRAKPDTDVFSLGEEEMRDLLTYLVIRPLFNETGDAGKGLQVFQTKKCVACHGENRLNPGAPPLSSFKGPFDGVRMTDAAQRRLARLIESERAPTDMRLKAQVASRLNQLRDTNLRPR